MSWLIAAASLIITNGFGDGLHFTLVAVRACRGKTQQYLPQTQQEIGVQFALSYTGNYKGPQ